MHRPRFCYLFAVSCLFVIVALADNDLLPKPGECGQMQRNLHFSRTNTPQSNEFPWMAKVFYKRENDNSRKFGCQAVLISQRYLISLSTCSEGMGELEAYEVEIGNDVVLDLEEIVLHPYFDLKTFQNDIALLRLSTSVTYTDNIRPICLPNLNMVQKEYGAEQLMLMGWTRDPTGDEEQKKHKKFVLIMNLQDCQRKYGFITNITDAHICAITCRQKLSFVSGSALMDYVEKVDQIPEHYKLFGLISFGSRRCDYPKNTSFFTRVDRYLSWISENIY